MNVSKENKEKTKGVSKSALEKITLEMASSLNLQNVLKTITQGLVDELGSAFARIWLLGPGDICADCYKAEVCSDRSSCLHLEASSGIHTRLNGEYRRIPFGNLKISQIAQSRKPVCTNDAMNDPRIPNKKWIAENKLQSFAGHPLIFKDELLGVVALFSRSIKVEEEFEQLAIFANQAATAIKNAQLFGEVEELKNQLKTKNEFLQEEIELTQNFEHIIGTSAPIKEVLQQVEQVSFTDTTVLIEGETGTGKELVAHAIHNLSPRKNNAFVKINCAALPAPLIESELFGHEKGAFTGALMKKLGRFKLADKGSIFLDEVGDLPLELQAKLLRVLQEGEFETVGGLETTKVDVRVIAATNKCISDEVKENKFRSDLFYRLSVFPISMPPLRNRKEDIPPLVHFFLDKIIRKLGRPPLKISQADMESLMQYSWPGNIRELQNVIERSVIISSGDTIKISPLSNAQNNHQENTELDNTDLQSLDELNRMHILRVLGKTDWVIDGSEGAAQVLGIHPNTLRSRMKKLGIKRQS